MDAEGYIPLTDAQRSKAVKKCGAYWRLYRKEERKCDAKGAKLNEVGVEMYETSLHCLGQVGACPSEADSFWRCFKSIRSVGEYQGVMNCAAYFDPLERCAKPLAPSVFEPSK